MRLTLERWLSIAVLGMLVWSTITVEAVATPTTRLEIPGIGLNEPILPVGLQSIVIDGTEYLQWSVHDNHIGWHNLSARWGYPGNTVLNGHSDVHAQVFEALDDVQLGDTIVIHAEQTHFYTVTNIILVQERGVSMEQRLENARLILPTEDERLTLVTCARPGATHRLIVIAKPGE